MVVLEMFETMHIESIKLIAVRIIGLTIIKFQHVTKTNKSHLLLVKCFRILVCTPLSETLEWRKNEKCGFQRIDEI